MTHVQHAPVVLTLDAGGTNFTFAAMQESRLLAGPFSLPAEAHSLDRSLANLFAGFEHVGTAAGGEFSAISFAFPGPADYRNGVIDNVGNLPAYAGGVPLADILKKRFRVPVYINNDGDLFTYGEAVGGFLPSVNRRLEQCGSTRRYRNLIGLTLGTGFGGGIVVDGRLLQGDNSLAAEVWLLRHGFEPTLNAEEGVSIRAIVDGYRDSSADPNAKERSPHDIARIASHEMAGDHGAAIAAFERFGRALGDAIATVVTLIDGAVVIGGGISAAHRLFMPSVLDVVNGRFSTHQGAPPRVVQRLYDVTDEAAAGSFFSDERMACELTEVTPGVRRVPTPERRIPIGVSRLGADRAVNLGAYAVAVHRLSESSIGASSTSANRSPHSATSSGL